MFWREHGIIIDSVRMDNQCSTTVRKMAKAMDIQFAFVPPHDKNHLISARAGFHRDCSTIFLDKCLRQIEMTLNLVHPFEYDPTISANEGVFGQTFNFQQHPIAPVGAKILTWDSF